MKPAIPTLPMPAARLLPHTGGIVLLDEVLSCSGDTLTARAVVRPTLFSQADGSLPPWMGLEILAQAIAAWAGWQALIAGKPPQLGFLLGTRLYECRAGVLAPGAALTARVTRTLQDDSGMGSFEGVILEDTPEGPREIAQARLTVYQPTDVSRYTQESAPA
jgi:predicted hotdog family 3-hydroxylacyl-ACP dehydratase